MTVGPAVTSSWAQILRKYLAQPIEVDHESQVGPQEVIKNSDWS